MFGGFLEQPVQLWLLLILVVFSFVLGIAVNRKFSATSGALAILGTIFTPNDLRTLAILIWRAGLVPTAMRDIRFSGDETNFANYFVDMVLKFLPEIGKVEQVLDSMLGPVSRDLETNGLNLKGRGRVKFAGAPPHIPPPRDRPHPARDKIEGWPLIDREDKPPIKIDPQD